MGPKSSMRSFPRTVRSTSSTASASGASPSRRASATDCFASPETSKRRLQEPIERSTTHDDKRFSMTSVAIAKLALDALCREHFHAAGRPQHLVDLALVLFLLGDQSPSVFFEENRPAFHEPQKLSIGL